MGTPARMIVICCWEGQVIAAVTHQIAPQLRLEIAHLITAEAPGWVLAQGSEAAALRLRENIGTALAISQPHAILLIEHAGCLSIPHAATPDQAQQLPRALARLQAWFPGQRVYGLWLDTHAQVQGELSMSPVIPTD